MADGSFRNLLYSLVWGVCLASFFASCSDERPGEPSLVTVSVSGPDSLYYYFPITFRAQARSESPLYSYAWNFDYGTEVDTLGSDLSELTTVLVRTRYHNNTEVANQYECEARVRVVSQDRGVGYAALPTRCIDPFGDFPQTPPRVSQDSKGNLLITPKDFWPQAPRELSTLFHLELTWNAASVKRYLTSYERIKADTLLAVGDTLLLNPAEDSLTLLWNLSESDADYYVRNSLQLKKLNGAWFAYRQDWDGESYTSWLVYPIPAARADTAKACPTPYQPAAFYQISSAPLLAQWFHDEYRAGRIDSSDAIYTRASQTVPAIQAGCIRAAFKYNTSNTYSEPTPAACPDSVRVFCVLNSTFSPLQ